MLEARWPKGPLLALVLILPVLYLINPWVRQSIRDSKHKTPVAASLPPRARQKKVAKTIPVAREGGYALHELEILSGRNWHRIAGADTNLPPKTNGHDEFAKAWLSRARANLRGLPISVLSQWFPVPGFTNAAASRPGRNIIVTIPGSRDPNQAVVIGSHYDGEPASRGSAFDDASGCSIMLALMRSLGAQWRLHGRPSKSVEFVLFDAEEQWVIGSGAYLYFLRHDALLPTPIMMIDEEQNGVGYPARPFGLAAEQPMPGFAVTTSEQEYYSKLFGGQVQPNTAALTQMASWITRARTSTFRALNRVFPKIPFRGGVATPFRQRNLAEIQIAANGFCCSDNGAFEVLGLPTFTYTGDYQYYNAGHPSWAYPYDQPQDTVSAMACDAQGNPVPGKVIEAALAIPIVMSARLINDYAPSHKGVVHPLIMSTPAVVGRKAEFSVAGAETSNWSFGDGGSARGSVVFHSYKHAGSFSIRVAESGRSAKAHIVVKHSLAEPHYWSHIPSPPTITPWHPAQLAGINGCP